jgi:hypothetical protein
VSRTLAILLVAMLGACEREPLPDVCPNVDAGQLVISELRGEQTGDDSFGHYLEIYNAAGKTVDLQGLHLRVRSNFDEDEVVALFVRESVELQAGGYAVIGPGLTGDENSWIDYAIGWDISGGDPDTATYPTDFLRYAVGFVELEACGERIDEMAFTQLPAQGTLACGDATQPPDADANDLDTQGCWCVDQLDADQPLPGLGLPGTPGRANRCP